MLAITSSPPLQRTDGLDRHRVCRTAIRVCTCSPAYISLYSYSNGNRYVRSPSAEGNVDVWAVWRSGWAETRLSSRWIAGRPMGSFVPRPGHLILRLEPEKIINVPQQQCMARVAGTAVARRSAIPHVLSSHHPTYQRKRESGFPYKTIPHLSPAHQSTCLI